MSDDRRLVRRALEVRSAWVFFRRHAVGACVTRSRSDAGELTAHGEAGFAQDAPSRAGGASRGGDGQFLTPRRLVTRSGEWRPRNGLWLKD